MYSVLITFSLAIFYIFFPFKYVDPINSAIYCPNNIRVALNSVVIFSVDGKIDSFNDLKARKQCAFNTIQDYHSFYPDPGKVDYRIEYSYSQESSILEALLTSIIFFTLGVLFIENFFYFLFYLFSKKRDLNFGQFYLNIISFLIN